MSKSQQKSASPDRARKQRYQRTPATRFILCESGQSFWIVSETNGRVTSIFPVRSQNPRLALKDRQSRAGAGQPRPRDRRRPR